LIRFREQHEMNESIQDLLPSVNIEGFERIRSLIQVDCELEFCLCSSSPDIWARNSMNYSPNVKLLVVLPNIMVDQKNPTRHSPAIRPKSAIFPIIPSATSWFPCALNGGLSFREDSSDFN
jgi:hypothetical protein